MTRGIALSFALLAPLAGCDGRLITIPLTGSAETTVQKGTLVEALIGEFGFSDLTKLDITSSSELQNQGVEPGDLTSVVMTKFALTVTDPDGADLAFLESLELWAEAPDVAKVLVATTPPIDDGATTVDMQLEDVDLVDHAVSQSMTLTLEASGNRPDVDTSIRADWALSVGVTAQGIGNALDGE